MTLVFDTETNGLPKAWGNPMTDVDNWPRVVQLAWALFHNDGTLANASVIIIQPNGWDIPEQASNVHGITTERAMAEGIPLHQALAAFLAVYERATVLVAHNIAFDYPVLGAEMLRTGIRASRKVDRHVCTMKATTNFCSIPQANGRGFKWPKLIELHEKLFGVGFDGAHDAMVDVEACGRCYFELIKRNIIYA